MSRVFAATDIALDRSVVIKVLEPELTAGVNVERFRREIQVAAKLQHAYIVPLLSAGVTDGLPYYTMPLVEGESLRTVLRTRGALPIPEAVRLLRDIAEALSYAHEHGVVHRDIKPENVLVTDYHAVVTDFGVAKALSAATSGDGGLTSVGVAIGTPAYMAPEQAVGDPATDHRADIYAFGVVAYEMITGQRLFSERSQQATLAAHAIELPEPIERRRANTPADLGALVMQCVEKHPADRPQTAREILGALDNISTSGATTSAAARISVESKRPASRRSWFIPAGVIGAVLLTALGWWLLNPREATARQAKLVVLPFENLGNPADEYFADGLSEEVTNRLVKLSGLSIVARSSAAKYRKSGKNAQEIGRELDADYVLDGTVRWARSAAGTNTIRVTPQLMKVSTGVQIWGEPFDAVLAEVFDVQTRIAENVAQALGGRLVQADRQALKRASTTSVKANDAYMLGRFHWKQRGTPGALERAAGFFQQAIAADPSFARAYSGLADTYSLFGFYQVDNADEGMRRAKAAAMRAIELDSTLAEGYASLAEVLYYAENNFPRVNQLLQRAIELDPGYATAHQWYGELLWTIAQPRKSVMALRKAKELEPLSAVIATNLAFALWSAGDVAGAEKEFLNALAIDPRYQNAHALLGSFYADQGKPDKAVAEFVAMGAPRAIIEPIFRGFGNEAARPAALASLHKSRKSPGFYAALGERDSAFAMLNRETGGQARFTNTVIRADPMYRNLRGDPRYEALLERAGVSDRQLRAMGVTPEQ